MSRQQQIVAALVTALNAHSFSLAFEAVRAYLPKYELKDLATLRIAVVAGGFSKTPLDRAHGLEEHVVHIGTFRHLDKGQGTADANLDQLDALGTLVEEIADFLLPNQGDPLTLPGLEAWADSADTTPPFDVEQLRENKQFNHYLTVTFKMAVS